MRIFSPRRNAEVFLFVNMGTPRANAFIVMYTSQPVPCSPLASAANGALFVIIRDNFLAARNVEVLLFVNMEDNALNAKNVEALLFVNMGDNALNAKNVEALLFANMGDSALMQRMWRRLYL